MPGKESTTEQHCCPRDISEISFCKNRTSPTLIALVYFSKLLPSQLQWLLEIKCPRGAGEINQGINVGTALAEDLSLISSIYSDN